MIRNIIIRVAYFFGALSLYFFPVRFLRKISNFFQMMYSGRISHQMKSVMYPLEIKHPAYIKGGQYISIGKNFRVLRRLKLEAWDYYSGIFYSPSIVIKDNVSISDNCHIGAINYIEIGNNVLMGSNVYITDHNHGMANEKNLMCHPLDRALYSKGPVIIEDDVWLGEGVSIMPNVIVGKGCIVGANSVVTKSFPPYSILGGCPAKIIKKYNI